MNRLAATLSAAFAAFATFAAAQDPPPPRTEVAEPPPPPAPEARRAVLVTGASSGIGRTTTELLARSGFFVYAGARKDEDLRALGAIENVQAIRLDVTSDADVDAAVATVRAGGRVLHAVINNAGVLVMGPLIELRDADLRFQFEANVFGPWRVTKAFAPLLIESRGRVLITGSLSGTVGWAFGGPYVMSKHAIEGFADVLAAELRPFGVSVAVVEPGNYRTGIMTSTKQRLVDGGYTTEGSRYRDRMDQLLEQPTDRAQYPEPDAVAAAFLDALRAERPKRRWLVVPNRREAELTVRAAIERVVQLDAEQPFTFGRDELVRMLDEALRRQK